MRIQPAGQYSPPSDERKIQEWWRQNRVYERIKEKRAKGPIWYFLDGPPYASGSIHLGTAWNKIIKDLILRYRTMRGYNVRRQPGWDCHGLPIEVKVEESLGIHSKKEIEERVGIDKFVQECKRWALEHVKLMTEEFKRLGVWMDWEDPYMTLKNEYIESAWWSLKKAYENGLLEKSLRVIHWCPRCETALAEHEVRGEYKDRADPSIYVKFKLKEKPDECLLIWTTTPWTLPANLAVCLHPELVYIEVEVGGEKYILAEGLAERVAQELGWRDYRVVWRKSGSKLEGLEYVHPLLDEVPKQKEFAHRVILGEHVTLEEGTGCVHTAPGHGEEDFEVGKKYNLPVFCPVDARGRFTQEGGKYSGLYIKDADQLIIEDLKRKGLLVKRGTIVHSYPHCWRCHTPLIFRATEQWFLRTSSIKQLILQKNQEVKWFPSWVKERYINGVESVGDWCLSRQRYWGIPMPIWVCRECGREVFIGSVEELLKLGGEKPMDLHRPVVDKIRLKCPYCGGKMHRIPDVLDVWFDSSIAAWASQGYPFLNQRLEPWPPDFITEGEDQVTKWFYAQQVSSVIVFGSVPYKEVLMHGFALDEKGRKMSKSLGNVIEPLEVVDKYGADVLRFYLLSSNAPWEDIKFSMKGISEVSRLVNTLWNAHVFATTYMSLDAFDPEKVDEREILSNLKIEDRWLLAKLNRLIKEVTSALEIYELHRAARALWTFIQEDLSRWYIRLVRRRTWVEEEDPSKTAVYFVLYKTFMCLTRLLAPFMPHLAERIHLDLGGKGSVHEQDWPKPDPRFTDPELEESMEIVRKIVEAGASARQAAGLKLRWPVKEIIVELSLDTLEKVKPLSDVLSQALNCKKLTLLTQAVSLPKKVSIYKSQWGRVIVDTELTEELLNEAMVKEIVRRMQMMRKEMGLQMEEKVDAEIVASPEDLERAKRMEDYIKTEVRIRSLKLSPSPSIQGYTKEYEIENRRFQLILKKL